MALRIPGLSLPPYIPPQVTPTSLVLHYYSQREGLWTWVEGIVDEVAREFFGIQIRMEMLRGRDTGDCDHEVGEGSLCQTGVGFQATMVYSMTLILMGRSF